jgi:SpoVK/Ycf46/Vps4 family AAA+-type ATPase
MQWQVKGLDASGKRRTVSVVAKSLAEAQLASERAGLAGWYEPPWCACPACHRVMSWHVPWSSKGPCEESMLNKLLNEMDGLKESADVLFILTTNRPETLEAALASRPGRVDQAIEFPLPDEEGREKLVRLYGGEAGLTDELVSLVVGRTDRVSAAFIKELMRRSVQFRLEREGATAVLQQDVEDALDEMLFSGGSLNVKLLGGDMDGQHAGAGVASLLPG